MQPFKYVLLLHLVASSLPSSLQALMKLPSHISQSDEVLAFFETKLEDLNPPTEWVTITVYLNHKPSVSISIISFIWTVRYQTHPSRKTVCVCARARVCVCVWFNSWDECLSPALTHLDPEALLCLRVDWWMLFERHCVLLIMISGRWHLIPKRICKDQQCHEGASEFKSGGR